MAKKGIIIVSVALLSLFLSSCSERDETAPEIIWTEHNDYIILNDELPNFSTFFTIEDDFDGSINFEDSMITHDIDVSVRGEYEFTVTVADESGNKTTETKKINVISQNELYKSYFENNFDKYDQTSRVEYDDSFYYTIYYKGTPTVTDEDGLITYVTYYIDQDIIVIKYLLAITSEHYTLGYLEIKPDNTINFFIENQIAEDYIDINLIEEQLIDGNITFSDFTFTHNTSLSYADVLPFAAEYVDIATTGTENVYAVFIANANLYLEQNDE